MWVWRVSEVPDDASFVEFTQANYASLFRTAVLLTSGAEAAEDLVQDTLTRLYPIWWRVEAADVPLAYVRRSLANTFLTSRRRKSASELVMAAVPEASTRHDATDDVVNRGFEVQLMAHLSQRQRTAIVMRFFHDLDDAAIAASIGCRPATVRSLISRALVAMRAESDRMKGALPGAARGSVS
jgi:RNA polymerase sigma-70 factor (sigma-E family)